MRGRNAPDSGHASDARLGVVDSVGGRHLLEEAVVRGARYCDGIGREPCSEGRHGGPVGGCQSVSSYRHREPPHYWPEAVIITAAWPPIMMDGAFVAPAVIDGMI